MFFKDTLRFSALPDSYTRAVSDVGSVRPLRYVCRVNCTCGGARVTWRNPSRPFPSHVSVTHDFTRRVATLNFNSLQVSDNGTYTCVITHPTLGSLEKNVSLTVLPDPVLDVQPEEVFVERGTNHTFKCLANRDATFTWNYGSSTGALPASATMSRISAIESNLVVTNIKEGDNAGIYYCHAMYATGEIRTDTGNVVETGNNYALHYIHTLHIQHSRILTAGEVTKL